jgi:hypothetical protein
MRRQKSGRKSRPKAAHLQEIERAELPPTIQPITTVTRTYRFYSTYDLPVTITAAALVGIAGNVGTATNSTMAQLARVFRLHRVSIWAPPRQGNPAAGLGQFSGQSCGIEWESIDNAPGSKISDRSVSPAVPAHVSSKPPQGSAGYQWQDGPTGGNIMILTAPVGSVIDVHITHVFYASGAAGGSVSANPIVVGALYYGCLDGVGTVRYPPADDLPTTY